MRLEEIAQVLGPRRCHWCGTIMPAEIKHYPHSAGYRVEGFRELQWLYVTCPKCKYDWALWKLGFSLAEHVLRQGNQRAAQVWEKRRPHQW